MRNNQAGVRRSRLALDEVAAISAYGAKAVWPSGFQLYQRGAPADGVFIVLEGHVVLRNKIKVGRGFVPVIATVGQTFGSEGLTPGSSYVTDASASEETKTMFLSGAQFRAFVRERPAQTIPLLSQIMSERAYLLEKLHELAALNVDQRLMSTLTHLSSDHSFTAPDGRLKLENNHHRLLCEMVGATRESIALALSRLVSAGIAERRGMTFLIEPTSLASNFGEIPDRDASMPVVREMSS
ncbi:MAG TPA: Crp/Fnr family transcriptional regulator [Gemmatimonadaceae bacterium]|jgi:CRP-like cAMP-binding protein|nr:Crp/Fnr family transcriptional regulator [Gemmatimonadaceae bacterium]